MNTNDEIQVYCKLVNKYPSRLECTSTTKTYTFYTNTLVYDMIKCIKNRVVADFDIHNPFEVVQSGQQVQVAENGQALDISNEQTMNQTLYEYCNGNTCQLAFYIRVSFSQDL
jgi:hypothetical protein